jgi:hypothetical protein
MERSMNRLAAMVAASGLLVAASLVPVLASPTAGQAANQVTSEALEAYAEDTKKAKKAKKSKKSAKKTKKAKKSAKKTKKAKKTAKKGKKAAKKGGKKPAPKKKGDDKKKTTNVVYLRAVA